MMFTRLDKAGRGTFAQVMGGLELLKKAAGLNLMF